MASMVLKEAFGMVLQKMLTGPTGFSLSGTPADYGLGLGANDENKGRGIVFGTIEGEGEDEIFTEYGDATLYYMPMRPIYMPSSIVNENGIISVLLQERAAGNITNSTKPINGVRIKLYDGSTVNIVAEGKLEPGEDESIDLDPYACTTARSHFRCSVAAGLNENFIKLLANSVYDTAKFACKDTSEVERAVDPNGVLKVTAPSTNTTYGIVVGTDGTPQTGAEFKLIAQIPHGMTDGTLMYGPTTVTGPVGGNVSVIRSFLNFGSTEIIIKEIGIVALVTVETNEYKFLIYRQAHGLGEDSTGIIVPPLDGASITVTIGI